MNIDQAQRTWDNELPKDESDVCPRCECQTDELIEVKFGRKYEYVCEDCFTYYIEHGFLNKRE